MVQADEGVEQPVSKASSGSQRGVGVAELGHDAIRGELSDYLDGSLSSHERERVEGHLGECADCSAYLSTLRKTVELVRTLPAQAAPSGVKRAILRRAGGE